ncbi:hypothetical protein AB0B45_23550 [Nonomuraea sp. NPDC049152]|uniref:hypothetical protein n=1 Tax=Nonomuraea sp. NPDC049152 TaxID=3154350 RepID=UPI0033C225C0
MNSTSTAAFARRDRCSGRCGCSIPEASLLDVPVRNIAIIGEDVTGYANRDIATAVLALEQCLGWYADGLVAPRPPVRHCMADLAAAFGSLADGTARHKLVVDLSGDIRPPGEFAGVCP